jgi:flagellar export protein FliJ
MRPFRFPLEAVLKLRRMKEEKALEEYAASVNRSMELRTELLKATQRQGDVAAMVEGARGMRFSASSQQAYSLAMHAAREEVEKTRRKLAQANGEKARLLNLYLETRRNAEVLQNLRAKQADKHRLESLRKEEREIEEMVMARRFRPASTTMAPL